MKRSPLGRDTLLLVRRSDRVRTYRGHWAAISGYLEAGATPLEQAREELREELGLGEDDVDLVRIGEPLTFTDDAIGVTWTVHPFLFRMHDDGEIHTDWEASASRWMSARGDGSVANRTKTSRGAGAGLSRWRKRMSALSDASHDPPRRWARFVDELRLDSIHGASWLARRAAGILAECADEESARIGAQRNFRSG